MNRLCSAQRQKQPDVLTTSEQRARSHVARGNGIQNNELEIENRRKHNVTYFRTFPEKEVIKPFSKAQSVGRLGYIKQG
jgi:hypothetical protein